jgi:hypothetical protein
VHQTSDKSSKSSSPVARPGRANGPNFSRRTDYKHHLPGPKQKRADFDTHGVDDVCVNTFLPEGVPTRAVYKYLVQRLLAT